jgi:L-threonylcarbamoyladenylate synthase
MIRQIKTPQKEIERAAEIIRNGGLAAFPTETVYGLGADAFNPLAVAKIFELKQRPSFDPLIVHISDLNMIRVLAEDPDERAFFLAEKFWPGPLTIVLPKKKSVPDIVTSGLSTVGIRMPDNPVALELIRLSGCPIAAPSANRFGRISPTRADHVRKQLPSLECVLDGGPSKVGIESTVIALNGDGFVILRQGVITKQDLESVLPESKCKTHSAPLIMSSPGHMNSHYSPEKPLYIIGESEFCVKKERSGLICFGDFDITGYRTAINLSRSSNLLEAAVNLFDSLHRLEDSDVETIVATGVPENGIGTAIMDRLRKAAFKYR